MPENLNSVSEEITKIVYPKTTLKTFLTMTMILILCKLISLVQSKIGNIFIDLMTE